MNALSITPMGPVATLSPPAHLWLTVRATARAEMRRHAAYVIDPLRAMVFPLLMFLTMWVSYRVSGRPEVDGANASGFLAVGVLGLLTFGSTIWSSGSAIECERREGTIEALFLSPASRFGVVLGYGLGSFVWLLPTVAVLTLVAALTGARLSLAHPLVPLAALGVLCMGSLCMGIAFSGLFVLTRRANLLANFLQLPVWLLAGFMAPRSALPSWLLPLSDAIPASHAIDALRAGALHGATFAEAGPSLLAAIGTSVGFAAVGVIALRRVEHVAKRSGSLDLH